ncbi:MAG: S8 family serine peptidase, partial [Synergistaceae bacterium]|nr:S8 family serine peptidase [Synergistaceae bacterium]
PHVAGAVALLKSYKPNFTASQVKAVIDNTNKANLSAAKGSDGVFNIADIVEYADDADNQAVIDAAEDLPKEYQDDPDADDSSSDSGSKKSSGGGSSGCASFNINLILLFAALLVIKVINKKYLIK